MSSPKKSKPAETTIVQFMRMAQQLVNEGFLKVHIKAVTPKGSTITAVYTEKDKA